MKDVLDSRIEMIQVQYVVEYVSVLHLILIDYGEATVKIYVDNWVESVYRYAPHKDKKLKWVKKKFEFILSSLNPYGLLYETAPRGYSYTIMKSVE